MSERNIKVFLCVACSQVRPLNQKSNLTVQLDGDSKRPVCVACAARLQAEAREMPLIVEGPVQG